MDENRMVKFFMDSVRIDSESGNEEAYLGFLARYLTAETGAECRRDAYGNLVARWEAIGSQAEPILLACHADTVKPGTGIVPVLENGVIRSSGDTILGADDKAGIAEVVEAVRTATRRPPVEFAVTRQEEVGLLGVKNLDMSLIRAREGYLLDGDRLDSVVTGGPTYVAIDVEIVGRSAHAGMEPEKGISSILAAARAIAALPLGRLDARTTANVGVIHGGIVRNGVPERTEFLAECRSLDDDTAMELAGRMEAVIRSEVERAGAVAKIKTNVMCRAIKISDGAPVVKACLEALRQAGYAPQTSTMTGFTDASIYNNRGVATAVLGIGALDEHSTAERVAVADMVKAVEILHRLMEIKA